MRLEWLPWIRQRNWRAFDDLAQTEPSWLLFDTVRELALGFPDEADRQRLQLVLRTLALQGYADEVSAALGTPAPEKQRPETYLVPCHPFQFATITNSDATGRTMYMFLYKRQGEAMTVGAVARSFDFPDWRQFIRNRTVMVPFNRAKGFKMAPPDGFQLYVEAPVGLVASRMARIYADEEKRREAKVPAWAYRDILKHARDLPHPADTWEVPAADEALQASGWKSIREMADWMLPVSLESDCMSHILLEATSGDVFSEASARKRIAIYDEHRDEALSPELIEATVERLNDLAFVLSRICRWDDAVAVASLARAVQEQQRDAPFFNSILEQTAFELPKHVAPTDVVAKMEAEMEQDELVA